MPNAIILLSGGLDSVTTAYYVKHKVKPKKTISLFFDYGQRTLKEEEYCARAIAKKIGSEFKKIELKWLGKISTSLLNKKKKLPKITEKDLASTSKKEVINYWVPCRNSIFLLSALAHAESEFISKKQKYDIYIGLKSEGHVPMKDTTPEFVKQVNNLAKLSTNSGNFKVIAPLIDKDKDEVIAIGKKLNVPFKYTYSCYAGSNKKLTHCGTCENCMQRKKGFYWANIKDPSVYK